MVLGSHRTDDTLARIWDGLYSMFAGYSARLGEELEVG